MESFKDALSSSADGIEMDVWRTKDNQIVINHDNTITTGESIVNHDFSYLKDKEKSLLLLSDIFEMLIETSFTTTKCIYICIELKGSFCAKTVSAIQSILEKYLHRIDKTYFDTYLLSFSLKYLEALHLFFPSSNLVYLTMDDIQINARPPYQLVCLDASVLSKNQVEELSKAKIKLWVYGAYNVYNVLLSKELGVEAIIVNDVGFTQQVFSNS